MSLSMNELERKLQDAENAGSMDDVLENVRAILDLSGCELGAEVLQRMCGILAASASRTWWCCSCGSISPESGEIDVICLHCGERRRLPERQRSPWPLYVELLKRLRPENWFSDLGDWMCAHKLARIGNEPQGPRRRSSQSGAYSSIAKNSGAEGSVVLPEAIDARGDVSPEKIPRAILCIDGMIIGESGLVRGCQWIALPMMPV